MMIDIPPPQPDAPTYHNPVYAAGFADPFVLKHGGEYWAYCTGTWHDGRCFGILHSRDLMHWRELAGAMAPLPGDLPCYWAPEVSYYNGRFYLYYSAGNEEWMQIRVAVAEHPAGPFEDSGKVLTREQFAIDAHVFADDDGRRYLFYATDFLDHPRVGTGTVRDQLLDPFTLAGDPAPVTRACYDWQIYDPQRAEKGGVRWHTIEGSFVLKHKGLYYQMFSGGNWQNPSYGVSYATTTSIDTPQEWRQAADGQRVLPILRTLPGRVIGPGHNSVVRGPDNRQLFCVYHRWAADGSGRQMAVDPLDFAGQRMLILGPSSAPQPAPTPPTFADNFDRAYADRLAPHWQLVAGQWSSGAGAARQSARSGPAEARVALAAPYALIEVTARLVEPAEPAGAFGVSLASGGASVLRCQIDAERSALVIDGAGAPNPHGATVALPSDFDPYVDHLLRVEVDGLRVEVAIDDRATRWRGQLAAPPDQVALCTDRAAAEFAGFAITIGWEDDFSGAEAAPAALGWQGDKGGWSIADQQLRADATKAELLLTKGPLLEAYELVLNARLSAEPANTGGYGWLPATSADQAGPMLMLERAGAGWALAWHSGDGAGSFALPAEFDPYQYQQWRCRKQAGRLRIAWEASEIGTIAAPAHAMRVGLASNHAGSIFDLVRVTALPR